MNQIPAIHPSFSLQLLPCLFSGILLNSLHFPSSVAPLPRMFCVPLLTHEYLLGLVAVSFITDVFPRMSLGRSNPSLLSPPWQQCVLYEMHLGQFSPCTNTTNHTQTYTAQPTTYLDYTVKLIAPNTE